MLGRSAAPGQQRHADLDVKKKLKHCKMALDRQKQGSL
jgi:hypothetical protein